MSNSNEPTDDTLSKLFAPQTDEAEKYKAIREFFSSNSTDTDLRTKTILKDQTLNLILKLKLLGEEAKQFEISESTYTIDKLINTILLENYFTLRISLKGEGRNQFFSVVGGEFKEEKKKRFFGLGEK